MASKKFTPILDDSVDLRGPSPVAGAAPPIKNWSFSFKHWGQADFFGLDKTRRSWFVSLLERLKALSNENFEDFLKDTVKRDSWRYHGIDWSARNCPISRADLTWLPASIRENDADFPMMQFHISRALGRVVGFFDNENVFNIVLLDPLHNIQPSKYHEYRVRNCSPLDCEYTALLHIVDSVLDAHCRSNGCAHVPDIEAIRTGRDERIDTHVVMIKITPNDKECYDDLKEMGLVASFDDVFRAGLNVRIEEV
ncbi:MAG: hypothetical protein AB1916_06420 [Thermodesulfobacteriota bacterium]